MFWKCCGINMNVWGHLSKERFNSVLRNNRCTCYCFHAHSFAMLLGAGNIPTWFDLWDSGSCFGDCLCHNFVLVLVLVNQHSIAFCSLYLKVVSMAKPNESTMKHAIWFVGKCYSMHRLNPSVSSSDHFYFQNLLESLNIKFYNYLLSSILTRWIVLVLFKMWKGK